MVVKVAAFLNHPLSEDAIQNVVMNSDFNRMKDNPKSNPDEANHYPPHKKSISFMRKGRSLGLGGIRNN